MIPPGAIRPIQIRKTLRLYHPTPAQLRVHQSHFKFNVVRFGRQSGKSTFGNNRVLEKAWKIPDGRSWYAGPTYRLATQMYERAMFSLRGAKNAALRDKSDSDLMIELLSGGRIYYLSGDNLSALPGETLNHAVVDECREQPYLKELWTRVLFPMLGTTGGGADFLSSPNGFDDFYDLDQKCKTNPKWGSFHAPSTECPFWTPEMLAEAKETMSEDLYAQEILAEFRDMGSGSCYSTFGEHNIRDHNPFADTGMSYSPHLPMLVGMDFNLSPMSWIIGQYKQRDIYWREEISQMRADSGLSPTQSAAEELVRRYQASGLKTGIVIIGDASGKAGQRSAPGGQSDYDTIKATLKRVGIPYQDKTPDANPGIKDRVNTVNASCKAGDGSVHMWFHNDCKVAIKDMRRRAWKEQKQGAQSLSFDNSNPLIGHMSDAVGYPICVLAPIKSISAGAKMRVITRSF